MENTLGVGLRTAVIVAALASVAAGAQGDNLLANAGFETNTIGTGIQNTFGLWQGDVASIVTSQNSIVPPEGSRMLKLLYTSFTGPGAAGGAQVEQAIDVSACAALIQSGSARAVAHVYANRIVGDTQTDTQFHVKLLAFSGDISDYYQDREDTAFIWETVYLLSDADAGTWEEIEVEMDLPADTTYIAFQIGGSENIHNDTTAPEFDGHYLDDAYVTILPEPASLSLVLAGGLALLGRRKHPTPPRGPKP